MRKVIMVLFVALHSAIQFSSAQITEIKLMPQDGAGGDQFAIAVSLHGDRAVIGADRDTVNGVISGSAYVFRRDIAGWVEEAKLTPSNGEPIDEFGFSVAISDDHVVIGAFGDDDKGENAGAVFVYSWDGSNWVEEAKLHASDGAEWDEFGRSVAISGDYVIVGSPFDDDSGIESGSAYIFENSGSGWVEEAKLRPIDLLPYDGFGISVSIDESRALIGAQFNHGSAYSSGSAYVYSRVGMNWTQEDKLIASDGVTDDQFGYSVSIDGDYIVVGAQSDDDGGNATGSAYVFHAIGTDWTQQAKLVAREPSENDYFGFSVSISGNFVAVGVRSDDEMGIDAGSTYLFRREGAAWFEEMKLLASDGAADDLFGFAVAIDGDNTIIGAFADDDNGENSGSAYVYSGFAPGNPLALFGVCYGSTGSSDPDNPGALITIDPLTGAGTVVGPTGIIGDEGPSVPALAIKSSGETYALSWKSSAELYQIHASMGSATLVAPTGLVHPTALAFDLDDRLFAIDENDNLFAVDEVTGTTTLIGSTGAAMGGLACDPTSGIMYGSDHEDSIFTVDVSSGVATFVGTTGLGGNTPDISFDQDGNLFGTQRGVDGIYDFIAIDKVTGIGTIIGPIGLTAVIGLAARPPVPDETDIHEDPELPTLTSLLNNYPNPFNPSTTIRYALREDVHVTLKVYNMLGQLVSTLVDQNQFAGYHETVWNGSNNFGQKVASGIYIYRMTTGDFTATKRMLVLK